MIEHIRADHKPGVDKSAWADYAQDPGLVARQQKKMK